MIPIRVRLAIDYEYDNERDNIMSKKQKVVNRNRSLDTYFPPLLHTTTTTTTTNNGGSNAPSTVSLVTDSSSMTVSEFTRYIVEEIYINNGEGHFIESNQQRHRCRDDQELEFVKILLQRLKSNGTNNTLIPNITNFRYGGRDTREIRSKKDSIGNHNGTSRLLTEEKKGAITNCLIEFSLIDEQTEGYAITLAPTVNADKMFQTLLCCSSHQSSLSNNYVKRLELILNAKVIIYRPTRSLELSTMTTSAAAAASSSELQSVIESAKKSKRLSSRDILPKSLFNSFKDTARTKSTSTDKQTGSPHVLPALRTQLEQRDCNLVEKNEIVRNATIDDEQLIDKSTTTMCGLRGSTTTKKTKKRKVANDDASKRTKQSHHDDDNNNDALAIQSVVELIDGVPPILDQAWQDQFVNRKGLLKSGHEQLIDSRNDTQESNTSCMDESMSSNHSSIILLSQENENLDDKCSIDDDDDSASSLNDSSSNSGSSSSSSSSDDSDVEDHHIVAPNNRASETSQLNPDADEHCTKDTNTSETVDSSSPSSSRDSSSDSDEPSIRDDDGHGDDDNRDDVADKNILPTENLDDSVFEAAHANNADSIVKADKFANQDELKNRDTSSVLNKNPSSESCSDDNSSDSDSDSSSSSSSSSSSDESEDEGSIVEGTQILIEEVAKSKIKTQQASQHNITHNAPTSRMIGRATPYHTSIDVSEQVFTQESEIVPTNLFGNRFGNNQQHKRGGEIESSTPPTDNAKIKGEDDKDESSSSTSDTSSSSDSSSDSDSESSNSSRNRKEGKGEAEDVVKPASIAPVPCNILPVVRPSRGRRRTPLVSMSRKIIINTTTGVPKTESFAR
jgi:hypothetical protein